MSAESDGVVRRSAIPLTVIGGFLGSGKTTLINRVLTESSGRRLIVIVNDFGEVNIDAHLIVRRDSETIALSNGCVCCSLGSNLVSTLLKVASMYPRPDHLIIEASGVSDPGKIAQIGRAGRAFRLSTIVVLVDAGEIRRQVGDRFVGDAVGKQLDCADLIVLNKCDLFGAEIVSKLRTWLKQRAPLALIVDSVYGYLPPDAILGPAMTSRLSGQIWFEDTQASDEILDEGHKVRQWTFRSSEALSKAEFDKFVSALPKGILRVKGFVRFAEEPEQTMLFQMAGGYSGVVACNNTGLSITTVLTFVGVDDAVTNDTMDQLVLGMGAIQSFLPQPG